LTPSTKFSNSWNELTRRFASIHDRDTCRYPGSPSPALLLILPRSPLQLSLAYSPADESSKHIAPAPEDRFTSCSSCSLRYLLPPLRSRTNCPRPRQPRDLPYLHLPRSPHTPALKLTAPTRSSHSATRSLPHSSSLRSSRQRLLDSQFDPKGINSFSSQSPVANRQSPPFPWNFPIRKSPRLPCRS